MTQLQNRFKKYDILLGSKSPRRKELLHYIIDEFTIISKEIDETPPSNLPQNEIAQYLAQEKAKAIKVSGNQLLITADTIVLKDDLILGKPKNKKEAQQTLQLLSGKKHIVITGVHFKTALKTMNFAVQTIVEFDTLTLDEINFYIENYNPLDKAGSYGIQDWIGAIGIKKITGDFYNVMGLPVNAVYHNLNTFIFD